jgi:predicted CopG family antitoxin
VGWKIVRLRDDVYARLKARAKQYGAFSISEAVAKLLDTVEGVEGNGVEKPLEKSKQQKLEESGGLSSKSVGSSVVSFLRILEYVRRIYSEKLGEDLALDETATLLLLRIIHCETGRDPTKELRRGRTWQELVEEFESELMKMLPKPLRDAFTNAR